MTRISHANKASRRPQELQGGLEGLGGRRGLRDDGEIAAGQVAKVEKRDGYFAVMRGGDGRDDFGVAPVVQGRPFQQAGRFQ